MLAGNLDLFRNHLDGTARTFFNADTTALAVVVANSNFLPGPSFGWFALSGQTP